MANHNFLNTLHTLAITQAESASYYSLPALEKSGIGKISRLPISIRIILESVLRNYDNKKITETFFCINSQGSFQFYVILFSHTKPLSK